MSNPIDLIDKSPMAGEKDLEAALDLQQAILEALVSLAQGLLPGVTIERKQPPNIAKKPQQSIETKPTQPLPIERIIYGYGINKLTDVDCQAIAAIITAKQGAKIIGSDCDYVIKNNGKVLFETTMGEITTHTRIPERLRNKIVNLQPQLNGNYPVKIIPTIGAADHSLAKVGAGNLAERFKAAIGNLDLLKPTAVEYYLDLFHQTKKGVVPDIDRPLTNSIAQMIKEVDDRDNLDRTLTLDRSEKDDLDRPSAIDEDIKKVTALFKVFGLNTNKEEHNTANGREGTLNLPNGSKLINRIDNGIAYLSLATGATAYELGAYNSKTHAYSVGTGLTAAAPELSELRRQIDPQTWLIAPASRSLERLAIDRTKPALDSHQSPRSMQPDNSEPDLNVLFNIEADENLIAKILTQPTALPQAIGSGVSAHSFATTQHQQIFTTARAIADSGTEVDLHSVAVAMAPAQPKIWELLATIVTRDNLASVPSLAGIVCEKQIRRDLLQLADRLNKDACDLSKPVAHATNHSLQDLSDTRSGNYHQPPPAPTTRLTRHNLQDERAERQTIAAVLQVPGLLERLVATGLTGKCFARPEHQEIYMAATELAHKQEEVNLPAARNRLAGFPAATVATDIVASTLVLPLSHDVTQLVSLHQRRELVKEADRLDAAAYDPKHSYGDLLNILDESSKNVATIAQQSPKLPDLELNSAPEVRADRTISHSRGK
jgi:DnaB-like helicase N terminal domain